MRVKQFVRLAKDRVCECFQPTSPFRILVLIQDGGNQLPHAQAVCQGYIFDPAIHAHRKTVRWALVVQQYDARVISVSEWKITYRIVQVPIEEALFWVRAIFVCPVPLAVIGVDPFPKEDAIVSELYVIVRRRVIIFPSAAATPFRIHLDEQQEIIMISYL